MSFCVITLALLSSLEFIAQLLIMLVSTAQGKLFLVYPLYNRRNIISIFISLFVEYLHSLDSIFECNSAQVKLTHRDIRTDLRVTQANYVGINHQFEPRSKTRIQRLNLHEDYSIDNNDSFSQNNENHYYDPAFCSDSTLPTVDEQFYPLWWNGTQPNTSTPIVKPRQNKFSKNQSCLLQKLNKGMTNK